MGIGLWDIVSVVMIALEREVGRRIVWKVFEIETFFMDFGVFMACIAK